MEVAVLRKKINKDKKKRLIGCVALWVRAGPKGY
jgi:hypothetical protein